MLSTLSVSQLQDTLKPLRKLDMTHTASSTSPTWTDEIGVTPKLTKDIKKAGNYHYRSYHLEMVQNVGTHIDAPSHFVEDGITACQIDINNLFLRPLCVINIVEKGQKNTDYELSVEDILQYEAKYGMQIPEGSVVVCYTGWEKYWDDKIKYRGYEEKDGKLHFPVFSLEAVKFLEEKRNIAGIGSDTLSPENDLEFPIHSYVLGKGKYIVENLANVGSVPEFGGLVTVLPIKFAELSEAPVRVVAMFE